MSTENISNEEKGNRVLADVIRSIKNFFIRNKPKKIKETYNNDDLHDEVANKIRDFVNKIPEFQVSPFIICKLENQKGFGVYADNGYGSLMKRFTIIIEDHKSF